MMVQAAALALIALILTPDWLFYFDVTPKLVVLLLASSVALVPIRRGKLMGLAMRSRNTNHKQNIRDDSFAGIDVIRIKLDSPKRLPVYWSVFNIWFLEIGRASCR